MLFISMSQIISPTLLAPLNSTWDTLGLSSNLLPPLSLPPLFKCLFVLILITVMPYSLASLKLNYLLSRASSMPQLHSLLVFHVSLTFPLLKLNYFIGFPSPPTRRKSTAKMSKWCEKKILRNKLETNLRICCHFPLLNICILKLLTSMIRPFDESKTRTPEIHKWTFIQIFR